MENSSKFYMVKKKALPEILLKVAEANALLNRGKARTIKEAIDAVGISRSSYYKYKDDIFPFHENSKGKTITMVLQMDDEPGLLSVVLRTVAEYHANILTIHQSIPVNGNPPSLAAGVLAFRSNTGKSPVIIRISQFHIIQLL